MEDENISYNAALRELESILAELRGNNCDIDTLAARVKRATALINICRSRLTRTEDELTKVLAELDGALK
ncbi:MAG: exodeoxyribonuclease VII small subunit [Muribaculaceae bacterium]|nr:exodeoxyribonuclease VII small subunit [Muribaculaceae bacterium]